MTLDQLEIGQKGTIIKVNGQGALHHHLLDMGLTPGTIVTLRKVAPMGDPIQMELRGYELTLRLEEAGKIDIVPDELSGNITETSETRTEQSGKKSRERSEDRATGRTAEEKRNAKELHQPIAHPRKGELGKAGDYHVNKIGETIPKGEPISFALAGNQNCGKTTLFNQLTGSNQHVGNFPGVTVDKKEGSIRRHPEATVTDLPGIYSLSPYSSEEIVTRDFLIKTHPTGIINIVDASNIERNLYLTMQLMELGIPMVLALNMMDEVRENGGSIRINELETLLGIPVVPISAVKNEGIDELIDHAMHVARHREAPGRIDFCEDRGTNDPGSAVHRCIHAAVHLLEPYAKKAGLPVRFAATKMLEDDALIRQAMEIPKEEEETLGHLVELMEKDSGLEREAALANMRFTFIEQLCEKTVVKPAESKEHRRSVEMDKILTGKYTAIPCFIGIMALVFILTFNFIGAFLSDGMSYLVDLVTNGIEHGLVSANVNPVVRSLVVDGICSGVGSVLSFLPTIVTLFFFLSILEDTGYMARVAFVMDKLLRKVGLSGRSIVPMLVGFGCSVPAVMATRTLSSERDRKMTILLIPFMSCSAKLPIYGLFTTAFFPRQWRGLVMVGLYVFGILCGILYAVILRNTRYKGEPVPFVMELPNYRMPGAKNVCQLLWDKAKGFLQKAFTIIFLATIVVWFLQTFDAGLNIAASADKSLLALIGSWIAPIFAPLGFGNWKVSTALITGFIAKESVVSTLSVLNGGNLALLQNIFTPFTAIVFLVFTLLYTPCVAAIATVRREMESVWTAILTVILQCGIAWIVAFAVHMVGMIIGIG